MFHGLKRTAPRGEPATNLDPESFAAIYRRFYRPLLRYVRVRLRNPDIAEEITQDVFLKAHRFRASYREEYTLSTWLWAIARNTINDHLRGLSAAISEEPTDFEEYASPDHDAEALFLEKSQRHRILRMLRPLTRLQRRALWLRCVHQLSYDEIAARLGVSLAAVKNLIYRAKLTLSRAYCPMSL